MEDRVIIGLTGSFGSGCSTFSKILQNYGFQIISISSFLRKEAEKQKIDLSKLPRKKVRKILQDIGNQLREKDLGFLIKEALKIAEPQKDIAIESIKNPGEIRELKRNPNSYVIALDTSFENRVNRIIKKDYDGDISQFERDDQREKDEGIKSGQRVQECVDLADIIINNDESNDTPQEKKEFAEKIVKEFIGLIKNPGSRYPSVMELWMNNAYSVSLQSSCLKRQVGAIIVKEGYAIAAGKNDVAPQEDPCKEVYEGECYRDELRNKIKFCPVCGGNLDEDFNCKIKECDYNKDNLVKLLDKCRSLHAEENAILQACYLGGVSLKDSILYTTTFPCKLCANKIITVGIKEIIYVEAYPDKDSVEFFKKHEKQVKVTKFEGVKASAFHNLFRARRV